MPPVLALASHSLDQPAEIIQEVARVQSAAKDAKVEGLMILLENDSQLPHLSTVCSSLLGAIDLLVIDDLREDPPPPSPKIIHTAHPSSGTPLIFHRILLPLPDFLPIVRKLVIPLPCLSLHRNSIPASFIFCKIQKIHL